MHANDFVINDGCAGQAIEGVAELLPHFDGKASTAFVIKAINAIDSGAFVVSAQEKEIFGVLDFVSKEEANDFNGLFAAIDVVA